MQRARSRLVSAALNQRPRDPPPFGRHARDQPSGKENEKAEDGGKTGHFWEFQRKSGGFKLGMRWSCPWATKRQEIFT